MGIRDGNLLELETLPTAGRTALTHNTQLLAFNQTTPKQHIYLRTDRGGLQMEPTC